MNTLKEHCPFHIEGKRERGYTITIGHDRIRVINVFIGTKSVSAPMIKCKKVAGKKCNNMAERREKR